MVVRKYWKRKRGTREKVSENLDVEKLRAGSPKVNGEPRGSTNPGLVGSGIGTWRKAKSLSGGRLEKAARKVAGAKTAQELQKRMAKLGMQPIAAADV